MASDLVAAADRVAVDRAASGSGNLARDEALLRAGAYADQAAPIIARLEGALADLATLRDRLVPPRTAVERHFAETKLGGTLSKITSLAPIVERDWPDAVAIAERHAAVKLAEIG